MSHFMRSQGLVILSAWMSLLKDEDLKKAYFTLVFYHPDDKWKEWSATIPFSSLQNDAFLALYQRDGEVALSSEIVLPDGRIVHIPMLDGVGSFEECFPFVKRLANKTKQTFYVFNSGRSFHLYGTHPVAKEEIPHFLSDAILCQEKNTNTGPDIRWCAHRMQDKYMCLRLSAHNLANNRFVQQAQYVAVIHKDP